MNPHNELATYLRTAPYREKGDGSRYYDCPTCRGKNRLEVHHTRPVWYCHKCGTGGSLPGNGSIRGMVGGFPVFDVHMQEPDYLSLYHPAGAYSGPWEYLRDRGLSGLQVERLRPHTGPSIFRVYLPLYSMGSNIPVYFVGRSIVDLDNVPKYLNPPVGTFPVSKSQIVWGLHRLRHPVKSLIICEGIFDAIWGENRIAILGTHLSKDQEVIIRRIEPEEIIVMLDGGTAKASLDICCRLGGPGPVYRVQLPFDQDPDSLQDVGPWLEKKERIV